MSYQPHKVSEIDKKGLKVSTAVMIVIMVILIIVSIVLGLKATGKDGYFIGALFCGVGAVFFFGLAVYGIGYQKINVE